MGNIERAIQRGAGGADDANYEEIQYEGHGPGGAAILLWIVTDNRNRTAAEIRRIFLKHGGSLGESGSVSWMFSRLGRVTVAGTDPESVLLTAADLGAEDVAQEDDGLVGVYGSPEDLQRMREGLAQDGFDVREAGLTMLPTIKSPVSEADQDRLIGLLEALDEHDDVQDVFTSAEFPEDA